MKRLLLPMLVIALTMSACIPTQSTAIEAELRATLVAVNVELTVQAQEIATLQDQLGQPTAACPECPTAEPSCTPLPPTETPIPTATPQSTGSISGKLGYPSEGIPPLRIVAFNILTGEYYWQNTILNQSYYSFEEMPVGNYYVLAYKISNPSQTFFAAYSEFVTCGLQAGCPSHALIVVEVKPGMETTNVDPIDWYGPDPDAWGWPLDPTINWN